MPSRIEEIPRRQHERHRDHVRAEPAELRSLHMHAAENATHPRGPHAGFDADLNPIDDEFINTRGSER